MTQTTGEERTRQLIAMLDQCQPSDELRQQRDDYVRAMPEMDIERPWLVTKLHAEAKLLGPQVDRIGVLDKARIYRRILTEREAIVWHERAWEAGRIDGRQREPPKSFTVKDRSPFAGSTSSRYKGVVLYPEFLALTLWPELRDLPRRVANPYQLTDDEVEKLDREVFPQWLDSSMLEVCRRLHPEVEQELALFEKLVFFIASKPYCISHTIPDFSRVVHEGLRAVIRDAQKRLEGCRPEQKDFYLAVVEVLEGVIAYAGRLADKAKALADRETDPTLKRELREIEEIYRRIPAEPARTFRDGLTAVWLCWIALHLENANVAMSLGRLDQLLWPLYQADVKAGRLTPDKAVELVGHLWLKIGDHVPSVAAAGEQLFGGSGSNQAITIGGVDAAGEDAVNDLTYIMLRATELMLLRDPNLNARYYPGKHQSAYLERLCDANVATRATPALHNDAAVIKALTRTAPPDGHSLVQARDYGVIGCVEPGACGAFYGHTGALLVNVTAALEMALHDGFHPHTGYKEDAPRGEPTGDVASIPDYPAFREAFKRQLGWLVDRAIRLNDALGRTHQSHHPTPILSALFKGPLDKGRDVSAGGAEINGSGIAIIGMADVTDSLSAIERWVFKGPDTMPFADLRKALDEDFPKEELRAKLGNPLKTPKYGTGEPAANANAKWLVETIDGLLEGRKNYRGGDYHAGYWTMTNHAGIGKFVGALPSGRKKAMNLASGITPVSGQADSLPAVLGAVASLPSKSITNGMAFNLKLLPDEGDRAHMVGKMLAYVKGYFDDKNDDGGMEIQFNVTDHAKFVEVAKDPDNPAYRDLLVRVSGYTAYFKDLAPRMRAEIIDRTEYKLSTGTAVKYDPYPLEP
jgi:formate C-acetyltransferase